MRNKNNNNIEEQKHQAGFSYIEVLISLFIVSIALILMHSAHNALFLNRTAKDKELALRIAASQMEVLRNTAIASLPASGSFSHGLLSGLPQGSAIMEIVDYNSRTKYVTVTVSWVEPHSPSAPQTVVLSSLMTENGL